MSTNNNYGEIFCTAIDEIISKRLEDLSYDISKVCTIVDDSSRKNGKYIVSDGAVRFEAYSTETDLSNGNSVMVTIPNGDYNLQKTIIGRIAADDTTPFVYTSPLDNMIKITNNIFDSDDAIKNEGSLLANDVAIGSEVLGTSTTALYSIKAENGEFAGFTRLGVSADFKSWLADLGTVEGTYGIVILAYYHDLAAPGQTAEQAKVRQYYFSSLDMIGNPYYFDSYFGQEKVFDISDINNIEQIDVYFFQSGNFKDVDGNLIPYKAYDTITQKEEKLPNNLFVDNVSIMLGYAIDEFEGETLLLSTPDGLSYHYSDPKANTKNILLRWIHKIDDTHYEMLNGNNLPTGYEVRWFRHYPGYTPPEGEQLDEFAGKDWEPLDNVYKITTPLKSGYDSYNPCKLTFIPNTKKQQELVRAIGVITTATNEPTGMVDEAGNPQMEIKTQITHYNCKENLKLENEEYVPDTASVEAATALQIVCEDGSEGNYFLYNQNGKIINEGEGQGKKRYFNALYQGLPLDSNLGKLDFIEWWMPVEFTMLVTPNEYYTENSGVLNKEDLHYHSVDYWTSTRKVKNKELTSTKMAYSIGNQWGYQKANNTVRCRASINGTVYEATAELRFGKAGTNGTNQTFLIEFEDNANGLTINDFPLQQQLQIQQKALDDLNAAKEDAATTPEQLETLQQIYNNSKLKQITVRARLYDGNGSRVDIPPNKESEVQWSWYKYTEIGTSADDAEYMILSKELAGASQVITCRINTIPTDNYYILKATYKNLEAYLPIPLKTKNASFIEGAREVIYNHQGNPNYYSDPYILYYIDDNDEYQKAENITWHLDQDEDIDPANVEEGMSAGVMSINRSLNNSYIPKLNTIQSSGLQALSASPMYASGFNDKVCVSTYDNESLLGWSQPILIMQSRYDFAMLNQWDGTLKMDEENGTIMATMLGAGRKNKDNTFSGVLIGDLAGGTELEDTEKMTGVYGLHQGEFSFALKEDGRAFFGKKGRGQIHIDGNTGTIKSHSYDTDGDGMLIDLDDGIIDIKGPHCNFTYTEVAVDERIQEELDNGLYFELIEEDYYKVSGKIEDYESITLYKLISTQASFYVSPFGNTEQPYLNINSNNGNSLIHIEDSNYYLQSDNIGLNAGSKLNLNDGILDIRSSDGRVYISGEGDEDYLRISKINSVTKAYDNHLFKLGNDEYYLKSKTYGAAVIKQAICSGEEPQYKTVFEADRTVEEFQNNLYYLKQGDSYVNIEFNAAADPPMSLDNYKGQTLYKRSNTYSTYYITYPENDNIESGQLIRTNWKVLIAIHSEDNVAYLIDGRYDETDNTLKSEEEIKDPGDDSIIGKIITKQNKYNIGEYTFTRDASRRIPIGVDGTTIIRYKKDPKEAHGWINWTEKIYESDILSTSVANYDSDQVTSGFKLDLENSRIDGYDLLLRGTSKQSKQSFVLDSGAPETPFTIGDNFKVSWDGTLNCNKINTLNNDGNTDKVISVNNNFYVSKSGGAGGSGCSFGGSFGGYCYGIGNFKTITVTEGGAIVGAVAVGSGAVGDTPATPGGGATLGSMVSAIRALETQVEALTKALKEHTHPLTSPGNAQFVYAVGGNNDGEWGYTGGIDGTPEGHTHKFQVLEDTIAKIPGDTDATDYSTLTDFTGSLDGEAPSTES